MTSASRASTSYGHSSQKSSAPAKARLSSASWRWHSTSSSALRCGRDRLADAPQPAAAPGVRVDELAPRGDDARRVGADLGHVGEGHPLGVGARARSRRRAIFAALTTTRIGSSAATASRIHGSVAVDEAVLAGVQQGLVAEAAAARCSTCSAVMAIQIPQGSRNGPPAADASGRDRSGRARRDRRRDRWSRRSDPVRMAHRACRRRSAGGSGLQSRPPDTPGLTARGGRAASGAGAAAGAARRRSGARRGRRGGQEALDQRPRRLLHDLGVDGAQPPVGAARDDQQRAEGAVLVDERRREGGAHGAPGPSERSTFAAQPVRMTRVSSVRCSGSASPADSPVSATARARSGSSASRRKSEA